MSTVQLLPKPLSSSRTKNFQNLESPTRLLTELASLTGVQLDLLPAALSGLRTSAEIEAMNGHLDDRGKAMDLAAFCVGLCSEGGYVCSKESL